MFPRRQKLMGKNNLIPRAGRGRNPFSFVGDPWVILEDNIIIITITILIIIVIMITTIISIRISIIVSIIITDIINIIIDITVYFLLWCRMRKLVFRDNERTTDIRNGSSKTADCILLYKKGWIHYNMAPVWDVMDLL